MIRASYARYTMYSIYNIRSIQTEKIETQFVDDIHIYDYKIFTHVPTIRHINKAYSTCKLQTSNQHSYTSSSSN